MVETLMRKDKAEMPPEGLELADRRAFLKVAAGALSGAAVFVGVPEIVAAQESKSDQAGGHLYIQTNEARNAIVHYHRSGSGKLTEIGRVSTGGAGSGTFKPISGQESAPNAFEGAGSVILTRDRRFLFAAHGGGEFVFFFPGGPDGRSTPPPRTPTPRSGG